MTQDVPTKNGLDALVDEAMGRKLLPTQAEALVLAQSADGKPIAVVPAEEVANLTKEPKPSPSSPLREVIPPTPDASFPFMVNGVKCLITIHVEAGAKVTVPSARAGATQSGPKVKGVRGRTEEVEAVSVAPVGAEGEKDPTWIEHPAVGLTKVGWLCPEHGTVEFKKSTITGREYLKCAEPGCGQVAPK